MNIKTMEEMLQEKICKVVAKAEAETRKAELEVEKAEVELETARMIQRWTGVCIGKDRNPLAN